MKTKLISVVMSIHNGEKTVRKAINSILNQDYENLELLLIDDGSTDNSYEICKEYLYSNKNIKLFKNNENIGLTKSLNILLKKANGYYIARQDVDDISLESRLSKQIYFMDKHNLDASTTRAFIMDTKKVTPSKSYYLPKRLVIRIKNPFIHGTLIAKNEVLQNIGLYDENFYFSQDYKLMSDFLDRGFRLKILKEPLYYLNMKGNISVMHKEMQEYYAKCVRSRIVPQNK